MKRQTGFTIVDLVIVLGVLIIMALLAWVNIMAGAGQAGLSYGLSQATNEMCDECVEPQACHRLWVWEGRKDRPASDCGKE